TRESSFTDSGYYQNGSLVRAIAMPTGGTNGGNSNSNNSGSSGSIDFGSNNSLYDDPPCSGCNGSGMQDCMFCGGDGMTKEFIPGGGRDSSFSSYIDADCSYCTGGQMRCRVCGGSG
ncbi:MAG: hypothetical protein LBM65_01250, partial [Oscillospiraceae bacterium]|nr:hypothetical protein [Oscillospiraceae bacterium]